MRVQSKIHTNQAEDVYEPDGSMNTATPIGVNATQVHSIYPAPEWDWVRISINQALNLTFTITTTQNLYVGGEGDIVGFSRYVQAPGTNFTLYLVPGSNTYLVFHSENIVDSYTLSVTGIPEPDYGNHDLNHTRDLVLEHPMYDVLNFTQGNFEYDWYTFEITQRMSIRASFELYNVHDGREYYPLIAELFDVNHTLVAKNHYFPSGGHTPQSILVTLDPGNYSLSLGNDATFKHQPYPYNLTVTSNLEEYDQYLQLAGPGWFSSGGSNEGYLSSGEVLYYLDGSLPANTTRKIVLTDWGFGAFHTTISPVVGKVMYSVLDTDITNVTSPVVGFVNTSSLIILLSSVGGAADYRFSVIQEVGDQYLSSGGFPYELHKLNAGTTYSWNWMTLYYPDDVDWWKFTPPRLGRLMVNFTSIPDLNVTVYNADRNQVHPTTQKVGGGMVIDFGEINSTFIFQVALQHPSDFYAQYNITITYIETYIPIRFSGDTKSGGGNPITELGSYGPRLGLLLLIVIMIMIVVQQWVKRRSKTTLD